MKALPTHPSLYQINTRVWLTELSKEIGRLAMLSDIPETGGTSIGLKYNIQARGLSDLMRANHWLEEKSAYGRFRHP